MTATDLPPDVETILDDYMSKPLVALDSDTESRACAALRWILGGRDHQAMSVLAKLSDEQRETVMAAATCLTYYAGRTP